MIFRVIDFETSGEITPEHEAGIIEYGFHDVSWEPGMPANIGPGIRSYVNCGIPVDLEARAVHHITDEAIATGCTVSEAIEALAKSGEGGEPVAYYVAHNAAFEKLFFPSAPAPFLCTYKIALRKWPDAAKHSNQFLRYYLKLNVNPVMAQPPHRALPDAYVTAHILAHILSFNPPLGVLERISGDPPQPDKIAFGKHKGQRWRDLPKDYLSWIVDKSDMDADTKWLARRWLEAAP